MTRADTSSPGNAPADPFEQCAALLRQADGLLVTAGAGMGVAAGLPDFRGAKGFWRAYPALGKAGVRFEKIANPASFRRHPRLAWGFYGHRLLLYRSVEPHEGYRILLRWARRMPAGGFVFTGNVDGLFQKAGFPQDSIVECHGSIHHLQCTEPCSGEIWDAASLVPTVDESSCRLTSELPRCPHCSALARPNILMFDDGAWLDTHTARQECRMNAWLGEVKRPVVVELGAGSRIATVRRLGESLGVPLIRINPSEAKIGRRPGVSLAMGALDALVAIDRVLGW